MNRRTRRGVLSAGAAAVVSVASPLWGPAVLRTVPAFRVASIEVTGARFVDPATARSLAAILPESSVWDDHSEAESRLESHPLIDQADVRRSGLDELTLELREVRPVALVSASVLAPVDGRGEVLPIDPSRHAVDLPILLRAMVEKERVTDEASRRALSVLDRLSDLSPDFVRRVSEVRGIEGDGLEMRLLAGSHVGRILLPLEGAEVAFLRAEDAIRECRERGRVVSVDARFRDQVVVALEGRT